MAGLLKTLEFCSLEEGALGLFSLISLLFPNTKELRRQNHVASTFCVYCQILLKIKDNFPIFFSFIFGILRERLMEMKR